MSIEIKSRSTPEDIRKALEKLKSLPMKSASKTMHLHFGKLKRGMDGLKYQIESRNDWD